MWGGGVTKYIFTKRDFSFIELSILVSTLLQKHWIVYDENTCSQLIHFFLSPQKVSTTARIYPGTCWLASTSAFRNGSCGPMTIMCHKCKLWKESLWARSLLVFQWLKLNICFVLFYDLKKTVNLLLCYKKKYIYRCCPFHIVDWYVAASSMKSLTQTDLNGQEFTNGRSSYLMTSLW